MANKPLTKVLPKTLSPFKVISSTLYTVTVDENVIYNAVSTDKVTLALCSARRNDGTDRDSDTQNANHRRNDDRTDGTEAHIIGEFPVQYIVKHVGTSTKLKYIDRWYGNETDADTVNLLHHILHHFMARYWNRLNRWKALNCLN